jgi:hypothetical protein
MAGAAQRLQPTDMGTDVGSGIATQTLDGADNLLQMLGWTIDALLPAMVRMLRSAARGPVGPALAATIMPRWTSSARAGSISR